MASPLALITMGQFMLHVSDSQRFFPLLALNRWNFAGFDVGHPSAMATNMPAASTLVELGLFWILTSQRAVRSPSSANSFPVKFRRLTATVMSVPSADV